MAWIAALGLAVTTAPSTLRDVDGAPHPIEVAPGEQLLVVVFLGTECPLARLYVPRLNELHRRYGSRGVRFLAIDSLEHDHAERVRAFAAQHQLEFPIAKDQGTTIADALRATRTPEVVVLDAQQRVRYRGRIDDQYRVGRHRSQATEHDLRRAIDELLAGKEVSVPEIEASGCLIPRRKPAPAASRWTYAEHIAPLINSHCATCHAAGRVGPMPLDSFEQVAAWASTIDEVVAARRMPPWHADRQFGRFANDLSLDDWQREMLRRWIAEGCPRGNVEPLPQSRSTVAFEWTIGVPDRVVSMPAEFVVPARGIIEYQVFDIDPGFTADRWATALEIRPGNRAVVHHVNVFLCPPGSHDSVEVGSFGSQCLVASAAGTGATIFPPGMAKRIPAGWRLRFVVHYVAIGSEQTDRSSLGLKFIDPELVEREVATRVLIDPELRIAPGAANHRIEHAAVLERDTLLLAMFPHMHLRGKSFLYQAAYADGRRETLLSVPRWDFEWQHRYELAKPKLLPAGTVLHCIAIYDNSAANPANPDPRAMVRAGPQNDDEMFNAYYDIAPAETAAFGTGLRTRWVVRGLTTLMAAIVIGWFATRERGPG